MLNLILNWVFCCYRKKWELYRKMIIGLCSVAGMLELQETLDSLIFQVLSLIIGSTLRDSKNKWTLALSLESLDRLGGSKASIGPLYWTWSQSMNLGNFQNVKKWKFWKSWARSEFRIWSCLECIYLPLKCLPLLSSALKGPTNGFEASIFTLRTATVWPTLRYDTVYDTYRSYLSLNCIF